MEDFIQITGSDLYPFWLCQHRLVEDIKVANQALKIWPRVNKYVKTVKSERRTTASAFFVFVASACDDTLNEAKLEFFVALAKPLQEFLLEFQTDAPMTFFLTLSERFVTIYHGSFFKKSFRKSQYF